MVERIDRYDANLSQGPQPGVITHAQRYFEMAENYVVAVEGLVVHADRALAPFHMLVGHSLELSLKAVLAHAGMNEERLMMAGHNLGHCHRNVLSTGFSGIAHRQLSQLVDTLDRAHSDQRFRYPVLFGGTPRLEPSATARAVRLHLEDVRGWIASPQQ